MPVNGGAGSPVTEHCAILLPPSVAQYLTCNLMYLSQTQGRTARPESLDAAMEDFTALHFFVSLEEKKKDCPIYHGIAHYLRLPLALWRAPAT